MSWYKTDGSEWKEIIEAISNETGRTNQMIEKDIIQSMFLYGLSKQPIPFVFKGGTSLSKVYKVIDRFSEDLDLSLEKKPSDSERKKSHQVIGSVANDLDLVLVNPDDVKSRFSYNKYIFKYDSFFSDVPLEIVVETNYYQGAYPVENLQVGCIVSDYCKNNNVELPIPFDAAVFNMNVQSAVRTLIDKVFAICDYRIENMQDRDSRHLYDIAKLVQEVQLTEELKVLVSKVREDRMKSRNNPSAQPEYNITEMLKNIISTRFFESDYNTVTRKLLYEDVSYDEAVEKGIAVLANTDLFDYYDFRVTKKERDK